MHKLKTQILSVDYYNETGVDRFYDTALHILYQDLNPEMEVILDKHSDAEELIRINSLVLNLGVTYETDLREQWIERFKTEFENELLRKIEQLKKGSGSQQESIAKINGDDLEILMFYLKTGSLPWYAGNSNFDIQKLFDRILIENPVGFDKKLRAEHKNEKLIQRIVLQFSNKQIEMLIAVLQPSESLFIIQTAAEIRKTQQRDQTVKSGSKAFRNAIWQFILAYLITDRSSYFSTREFVSSILHRMAGRYNIGIASLIQKIYASIHLLKMEAVHFQLGNLLQDIYEIEIKNKPAALEKEIQNQQIIEFLKSENSSEKMHTHSAPYYSELLVEWIKTSPLTLRQFLLKNANEKVLRKVVHIISDQEIGYLIQVINPSETTFVVQFKEDITRLQYEKNWINTGSEEFRDDLWVLLLHIILNEKNSFFSQKVFVIQALERLSVHYNLNPTAFIGFILNLIDKHENSIKTTNLFYLFAEIRKDFNQQKEIKRLSEKEKAEFYLVLLTRFISGEENPENTAESAFILSKKKIDIVEYLIQNNPKQLLNWMAEHLRSEEKSIQFIRSFSFSELRKIIEFLGESKGKEIGKILELILHLELSIKHQKQSFTEFELFRMAFVVLNLMQTTDNAESHFLEQLIQKIAVKIQISESEILKSLLRERAENPTILSDENKLHLMKVFPQENSEPEKTTAFQSDEKSLSENKEHINETSNLLAKTNKNGNDPFEKETNRAELENLLKEDVSKITSINDLQHWLSNNIDAVQATDLGQINKILKVYFGRVKEKNWKDSILSNQNINAVSNRIANIEKPFLSNYISDFEQLFTLAHSDFKVFNVEWLKLKILQFWSEKKDFTQKQLSHFLLSEIAVQFRQSTDEIKATLFKSALSIKRSLNSTLILDLGAKKAAESNHRETEEKQKIKALLQTKQKTKSFDETINEEMETIYVTNAGLVLLNPFIPVLFERAGLARDGEFISTETQNRAVHLLNYCATASADHEEHLLPLTKILCGMEIDEPIENEIELTIEETDLVKSLLENVIHQWSTLGGTTIDGLQMTFLTRNGALKMKSESWELTVEQRPFDMLIDKIPWTFNLIKYAWMEKPLYTLWR